MDRNRLLELAITELQRQKGKIDEEIAAVKAELGGTRSSVSETTLPTSAGALRKRTSAQRRAQSAKMKKIWAARRAQAQKPAVSAKTAPAAASGKTRSMTAARKKALSLKMREVWKKRKTAAAKKAKTK
jgi:hypothetical protein